MGNCLAELEVAYLGIDELKPNPRNARTHSKRQIRQIAASIREFGFVNAVLIDENRVIIAGHGRWAAAKLLGHARVPTVRIDHLTEDQKRAFVLADNKLAEKAGWDRSILAIELQHLIAVDPGFDVTITGFDVPEIDLIIGDVSDHDADDEVDFEEVASPVAREGDLWLLGGHRLVCGDALRLETYDALMGGRLAHAAFTDPPYNVRIQGNVTGNRRHQEFRMASGEMTVPRFTGFLERGLGLLARHSVPGSLHYVFMDWRHQRELLAAADVVYHELRNLCVWVKPNAGLGSLYRSRHELVYVFGNGPGPYRNNVELGRHGRDRSNVWEYPGGSGFGRPGEEGRLTDAHPTPKPVAL
ncbi:MAG TPA: site-specific DNA-methyltransferase, partial [Stellaceae bacterium]|nr:site-specific DNA-methyltransferase [Stellaceae bacterium]